jgi:hypothetical protein
VGQRTRGALERLLCTPGGAATRTVGDYLAAPWLGMHGLVDLLAAREERELEAVRAADRAPAPERKPILVVAAPDVGTPSRVLRRGGATVRVAPEQLASAEAVLTGAAHCVLNWGLCTIDAVVSRLRALTDRPLLSTEAARILGALPRFRWLDREAGWFSLAGTKSRLTLALRKIFAVTDRVLLRDLRAALSKQVELVGAAPPEVIETYLSEIAGCAISDGWVSARKSSGAVSIGRDERTIVAMVQDRGGDISTASLRKLVKRVGLSARTFLRVVRTSPLLLERGGRLRMIGAPRPAFASLYLAEIVSLPEVDSITI